jgi:AraC-like DNA-binding protein
VSADRAIAVSCEIKKELPVISGIHMRAGMSRPGGDEVKCIIKYGSQFMAISDRIEADRHKHWMLQLFLSSRKELNMEVQQQLIPCGAIIVNMDTWHMFQSHGEPVFTMLVDPVSELGRRFRGLLSDQPYHVLPRDITSAMQDAFNHALAKADRDAFLDFARKIVSIFSNGAVKSFDERVHQVLRLLDECAHEDEEHQVKYFSEKAGLSQSRLAHLFKEETGVPLKSYIVLHKLQKAYDAIFVGENFTTAALNAGFDSPSHFAYTNKLMTGMSATSIIKNSEFLKAPGSETW